MKTKLSGSVTIKVENTISVLRDVKKEFEEKSRKNMRKKEE